MLLFDKNGSFLTKLYLFRANPQIIQIMSTDPNKKYTQLRTKLDNLGMLLPLHPDSIPLVDKLLKQLFRVSQHYQTLKRQRSSQPQPQDSKPSDYKLDLLNKQYHQVLEQNKALKGELEMRKQGTDADADRRVKILRDKYDNKIAELTDKIVALEKFKDSGDGQKQELRERVETLLEQNHSLSFANKKTQKLYVQALQQVQTLKQQIRSMFAQQQKSDKNKASEIQGILQKKTAQLQQSEQNNMTLKAKVNALTRDLEVLQAQRRQSTLESKTVMGISDTIKSENRELERSVNSLKEELMQTQTMLETLKRSKTSLETELYNYKERELTAQAQTSSSQYSKNRLQVLYQDTLKSLQAKKLEVDDLNHTIQLSSRQSAKQDQKIRDLSKKNLILNNSLNEMQTELQTLSNKLTATLKENREIENAKLVLTKKLQQVEEIRKQEKDLLKGRTKDEFQQMAQSGLRADAKNLKAMEAQGKIYQEQIAILKQNQQSLVVKNQKLQSELRRMETLITNGGRQLELANTQKQALMKQIHDLKSSLSSTQNSQHNSKTSLMTIQEKLNSSELLVQDLKTTLQAQCQKTKTLTQQLSSLQSTLKQSQQKSRGLFNDNVQLRRLCESLQSTKSQLFEKLKLVSSSNTDTSEQKLRISQQHQLLREALNRAEQQLRRKQTAMITIDDERDQMQILLDSQTEQNSQLKRRIDQLETTVRTYNKDIDKSQMSVHQLQNHAANLQSENDLLRRNVERMALDLQAREAALMKAETNFGTKTGEVDLLVLSNKDLQRELDRMRAGYNQMERRLKDRTREHDGTRQEVEVLRMENAEVSDQYRQQIAERKRLQGHVQQLQAENHNMYQHLQQRDRQVAQLSQHVLLCQQKQNQYLSEIASYERQLGMLTNQLALRQDQLQRACAQRQVARSQQSRRRQPLQLKAVFQQRLQVALNESQLWKRQCDALRRQVRQLQKILQQQRTNNFKMSRQLQQRANTERATPIKTLMGKSMFDSNAENSSLHANSVERPEMRLQESFESHTSINSKQLLERVQQIEQQYKSAVVRNKY